MGAEKKYMVTLSTVPTLEAGRTIARALVENHLVACVNIVPGLHSIYEWEGKIEEEHEALLFIKSTQAAVGKITEKILEIHPYDCPEVISIDIRTGSRAYLDWIDKVAGEAGQVEEDR